MRRRYSRILLVTRPLVVKLLVLLARSGPVIAVIVQVLRRLHQHALYHRLLLLLSVSQDLGVALPLILIDAARV
jgi:hypothetical protein